MSGKLRNLLIFGFGISGKASAKLAAVKGYTVFVYDDNQPPSDCLIEFPTPKFTFIQKENLETGFQKIVLSPGIPLSHPVLKQVLNKNPSTELVSEIDFALADFPGPTIGVTGTNGKSTVCKMISHILNTAKLPTVITGNYGVPPSQLVLMNELKGKVAVIELSSYQLETTRSLKLDIGIWTNFSQDHLLRHKTMQEYFRVKSLIFPLLKTNGIAMGYSNLSKNAKTFKCNLPKQLETLENKEYLAKKLPSPITKNGKHFIENALFAITACQHLTKKSFNELKNGLQSFEPLPYRTQIIGKIYGKLVVNDSKSTNVNSILAAMSMFQEPILLLIGGQGKGESFLPVLKKLNKNSSIVTFGEDHEKIKAEISPFVEVKNFSSLKDALNYIHDIAHNLVYPILFSPGCASFDEFKNFEDRGKYFSNRIVQIMDGK